MKAYWTDTIIDRLVPAGTDVERGGPIEIYLAGDVAELAKRCLGQIEQWTRLRRQGENV